MTRGSGFAILFNVGRRIALNSDLNRKNVRYMYLRLSSKMAALVVVAIMAVNAASARTAMLSSADPIILYGKEMAFDVFRKNERVGRHTVRFQREGAALLVKSSFELSIDAFFLTFYQFSYESNTKWRDGAVESLEVQVDDNGEKFYLKAHRQAGVTVIKSSNGNGRFKGHLFPTNHWDVRVLTATQVLNTLTGKVNNVRIEPRGQEDVSTERGKIMANRYSYTGELETEVWYDEQGRWVKMRFSGKDGIPIEYVCRHCQGFHSEPLRK